MDHQLSVVLNEETIDIPSDLIENESVFKSVLSYHTWQSLSPVEKAHLQKYLPPSKVQRSQEETIRLLFSEDPNFKHGNAVDVLYKNLKAGRCSPSIARKLKKCRSLKYKDYKRILDQLARHGPGQPIQTTRPEPIDTSATIDERVHKKLQKVLKDVKTECNDDTISSDEEEFDARKYEHMPFYPNENQFPHHLFNSPMRPRMFSPPNPAYGFPPYRLPNTGTEIPEEIYRSMLDRHRKRRLCSETHPELDVSAISLADIIMRANPAKKGVKKSKKVKKLRKNRDEKVKMKKRYRSQLPPLSEKEIIRIKQLSSKQGGPDKDRITRDIKTEDPHDTSSENDEDQGEQCFFTLIRGFFLEREDLQCSALELQQEIAAWENSDEAADVSWIGESSSWPGLVLSSLNFLAGSNNAGLSLDFVPLVTFIQETNTWKWTGISHDDDNTLTQICRYWLDSLQQDESEQLSFDQQEILSPNTSIGQQKTDFVVRPSTDQEKLAFQLQERKRYENPHKPFIYKMHGFSSIVGPVKGVFNKDTGTSKAREHALLISNRPAYVTILSLVRDAVARLPNGEGTRAEVCQLLKDSAYINPEATDAQIHAVVSGALDRLHAEKDPCVKYDITRKLWVYLHRIRSVEEFERIHQASAAAAMAKKQLNQKQKGPSKKRQSQEQGDSGESPKIKPKSSKASNEKPKKSSKKSKPNVTSSPATESAISAEPSDSQSTTSSGQLPSQSERAAEKEETAIPSAATTATTKPSHFPDHLTYFAHVRGALPVSSQSLNLQNAVPLKITFPRGALGSFQSNSMTLHIPKPAEQRLMLGASRQEPARHLNLTEHLMINRNAGEFLPQMDSSFDENLQ
eukprot:gene16579-8002_t